MFCLIAQFNIFHFGVDYQIFTSLEYFQNFLSQRFGPMPRSHLHYLILHFALLVPLRILLKALLSFFGIHRHLLMTWNFHFFFFSFLAFLFFYSNFLVFGLISLKILKNILLPISSIKKKVYKSTAQIMLLCFEVYLLRIKSMSEMESHY